MTNVTKLGSKKGFKHQISDRKYSRVLRDVVTKLGGVSEALDKGILSATIVKNEYGIPINLVESVFEQGFLYVEVRNIRKSGNVPSRSSCYRIDVGKMFSTKYSNV